MKQCCFDLMATLSTSMFLFRTAGLTSVYLRITYIIALNTSLVLIRFALLHMTW